MKRFLRFFLVAVCFFPPCLLSQSTSATISGGVTDPTGNFIPGAEINIVNDTTGLLYPAKTNDSGIYLVPILPPGHYHVQVSKRGFKTIIKPDVILNVQSALALNFVLPVGATSESVTVEAGSSLLNTADATVSTVIDRKFVENIPLNGRSFQDLISMTPGVVTQSPQSQSTLGYSGDFSVNGQRTESNYYTVDGVSANTGAGNGFGAGQAATGGALGGSTALGTTQSLISVDALQEFRVQSSTYSAEFGRTPGGQFSLATRSGTNIVHGSAYDYLRNNYFDANDWFNDHYGASQPALRQSDFGGTFGGPVWFPKVYDGKGKTFFFFSYEGLRLTQPQAASLLFVPSTSLRQIAAPPLRPILSAYPLPTGPEVQVACNGTTVLCPPGSPIGTSVPSGLSPFIAAFSLPARIDSTSIRLDHVFSRKLAVFFRYGDTPSFTSSRDFSAITKTHFNTRTYTIGATSQLTTTINNELRFGYAHALSSVSTSIDDFGGAVPINLSEAVGAGAHPYAEPFIFLFFPGIGRSSLASPNTSNVSNQWNITDTLNVSHGRHQMKFGIDYRHIGSPLNPSSPLVEAIYESRQSLITNQATILDLVNRIGAEPIFNETGVFAQDEWHAGPSLSLSFGLRWEINPPPHEAHGNDAYTLLGNLANPSTLQLAPQGTPLWKTTYYNFAPRLGVAWQAHTNPGWETVVRAGGGVFFDTDNSLATQGYSGIGFSAVSVSTAAPLPVTEAQLSISPSTSPPYTSSPVYAFPQHLQLPYTLQWNVSVQQSLGRVQAFTLSYIGSSGRRLIGQQELSLSKFNPNFGTVYYLPGNITSNYQALQAQFRRSVVQGVQALASYTWSHSIDLGSAAAASPVERGNSDFDVRNNFSCGLSWDLPDMKREKVLKALLSHWGLDGRFMARTGFPIILNGNLLTDPASGNQFYSGVNLVAGQPIYLYRSTYPGGRSLNPLAFSLPTGTNSGEAPRNFVRGFGATQINIAARREFPLWDRLHLQFRAEAFNVLNHPNFGFVDPTLTDVTFGQATQMLNQSLGTMASQYQQGGPRSMQFALKLVF
jgi:hypothetical protein